MELCKYWDYIIRVVNTCQKTSMHCSIASVDQSGLPNITPIGTMFLRDDLTGYFFDAHSSKLSSNLSHNNNVCISAVNTSKPYWFASFYKGQFLSPPGVRLYGKAGGLRVANDQEIAAVRKRTKSLRKLKGAKRVWSNFTHVRDIEFDSFRPVLYPKMMKNLW